MGLCPEGAAGRVRAGGLLLPPQAARDRAVTRMAVQRRLPLLPSLELSEPTARRNPLTMLPITPCVCVLPTVLREGPPLLSRFFLLALFF